MEPKDTPNEGTPNEEYTPIGQYLKGCGAEFTGGPADQNAMFEMGNGIKITYSRWTGTESIEIDHKYMDNRYSVCMSVGSSVADLKKACSAEEKRIKKKFEEQEKYMKTAFATLDEIL